MVKLTACIIALLGIFPAAMAQEVRRPPITGFSHVAFYSSSPVAAKQFYAGLLGLEPGERPGLYIVGGQSIEAEAEKPAYPPSLLSHIALATPDAEGMRRYLESRGVQVPARTNHESNGTRWFALRDPEGHPIEFVQESVRQRTKRRAVSSQIIH